MIDKIVATIFSIVLVVFGRILLKKEQSNLKVNKEIREKTRISTKQIIRRIICSYLIISIGLMIFVGFIINKLEEKPFIFSIYWGICFFMVFLLLLLAYGDIKEILFHFYGRPPEYPSPPRSQSRNNKTPDE